MAPLWTTHAPQHARQAKLFLNITFMHLQRAVCPQVRSIVEEYFASGSIDDVADSLEELGGVGHLAHYFVKRLVTAALDRKDREREMASTLLSSLYAEVRVCVNTRASRSVG